MSRFVTSTFGRSTAHILAAMSASIALGACGGGSGNSVVDQPGVALHTSAGSAVTVAQGSTVEFTVEGGGGTSKFVAYTVSSSDLKVATAVLDGARLKITGNSVGDATVTVTDSAGSVIKIATKVPATVAGNIPTQPLPLYTTAPDAITVAVGASPAYKISGGSGPFTISTNNAGVAEGSIFAGDQVQIRGIANGVADVVVFDVAGATVKIRATIGDGNGSISLYTTAPDKITVAVNARPTYKIAGGLGPFTVTSSNVAVATVSQAADTFTVTGVSSGSAVVSVHDSKGSAVTVTVDVN